MVTTPTVWHPSQRANTTDSGPGGDDQFESKMVQLSNGNFVVLWTSNTDSGVATAEGNDIIAQVYDPEGNKIGAEFRANQGAFADDEDEFEVAAMPDGGFVLVFEDTDDDGASSGTIIRATVWESDLSTFTNRAIAPDPGADDIGAPTVSVNDDGSFIVGYQQTGAGGATSKKVVVSAGLVVGPSTTILSGSANLGVNGQQIASAHLTNDTSVFVDRRNAADDSITMRILNEDGGAIGRAKFVANTNTNGDTDVTPDVAALTGGGFVVTWANTDANDTDIEFQRYNAAGVAQGAVGSVNAGGSDNNLAPSVIGLADGGFFIAYDDNETNQIVGQRFNALGASVGVDVIIDPALGANFTGAVELSLLQDGRIAASWTNTRISPAFPVPNFDSDVDFAIIDPRENSLTFGAAGEAITTRLEDTTVNAGAGNDTVFGQGANDTLNGDANNDSMLGGAGNDTMNGGGGFDTLEGGLGADSVIGASGDDVIGGGGGKDTLVGGAGDDDMVFDTAIEAPANADVVQGFSIADDTIVLDNAVFVGLAAGVLNADAFVIGPAQDGEDRIIYSGNNGALFFDQDGTGGAFAAQRFATLPTGLALTNLDFEVI